MALVFVVYVPNKAMTGPDLTRMNKVEDQPDEVARMMLNDCSAREPTADEVAEYEATQQVEDKAADADLSKMLKGDLEKLAADLELDVTTAKTKADLVAAIEAHRAEQSATDATTQMDLEQTPGADHSIGLPTGAEPQGETGSTE